MSHAKYRFLLTKFSSFSRDEEVHVLLGLQHLRSALHANHGGQPLGIILGVEDSAGPGGFLPSGRGSQHITHFTVEVGIRRQFIENQVPDTFYCIPVTRAKRGDVYLRKCLEKLLRDVQGHRSLSLLHAQGRR